MQDGEIKSMLLFGLRKPMTPEVWLVLSVGSAMTRVLKQ